MKKGNQKTLGLTQRRPPSVTMTAPFIYPPAGLQSDTSSRVGQGDTSPKTSPIQQFHVPSLDVEQAHHPKASPSPPSTHVPSHHSWYSPSTRKDTIQEQ